VKITLFFVFVLITITCVPLFTEVPPSVDRVYPVRDSVDVPVNSHIWLYGPSLGYLSDEDLSATLRSEDDRDVIDVSVKVNRTTDYSRVSMKSNRSGGWVGPSGNRYLVEVVPSRDMMPSTVYVCDWDTSFDQGTIAFTTGEGRDEKPPAQVSIVSATFKRAGRDSQGKRNVYTALDLKVPQESAPFPFIVEIFTGNSNEDAGLETFILVTGQGINSGQLWGHFKGLHFCRTVDMCGNSSPLSMGIKGNAW
jgi:hypothetical protein